MKEHLKRKFARMRRSGWSECLVKREDTQLDVDLQLSCLCFLLLAADGWAEYKGGFPGSCRCVMEATCLGEG